VVTWGGEITNVYEAIQQTTLLTFPSAAVARQERDTCDAGVECRQRWLPIPARALLASLHLCGFLLCHKIGMRVAAWGWAPKDPHGFCSLGTHRNLAGRGPEGQVKFEQEGKQKVVIIENKVKI
jgi:hypothetical protein